MTLESNAAELAEARAIRALLEGTAHLAGVEFFQRLVELLARTLEVEHAFVAEFTGEARVRTLAYWRRDRLERNVEYDLAGTPCEEVARGSLCHYPHRVWERFPRDQALADLGIESYIGVPLVTPDGQRLGHLAVFDRRPSDGAERRVAMFRLFAARAATELERLRLEQALAAGERKFRDLYDEAPIAYVQEDLQSRFLSANRAACRILGITADEVPGCVGMSFIPDTPEAQRRVQEAFASIGAGADAGGVVLELRRRDNGQPIWIEWWSRPDPSGQFTRTMFIDITSRVLAEREKARLEAQNTYLREELKSVHNFDEIIGGSSSLRATLDKVSRVAAADTTVLVTGETGTGKELVARAIHSASRRRDKPLIKLNCAALPAGLVESELFGHERGAFSGAVQRRAGRFELAHGGTIFLDEIGELTLDVQAKLLRVLQEREFERVGGAQTIPVDVRVIAATNRDLKQLVRDGVFREDLYYRLNVVPIALPPLRERLDDIRPLVHHFVGKFAAQLGRRIERIAPETLERLAAYRWPGNIRELQNVIERAMILASGPTLEVDAETLQADLGPMRAPANSPPTDSLAAPAAIPRGDAPSLAGDANAPAPLATLADMERAHVLRVLAQANWVIEGQGGAARQLGLHPNTLRSRLKKLGISRPQ